MRKTKTVLKFILSLAMLNSFFGCEPEPLDIDVPQADSKLVLHSQALPDQALVVALSKSFSALSLPNEVVGDSTKQDSVNNAFLNQFLVDRAIITITGPDYSDTLEQLTKGVFVAPFFPYSPGNAYQLMALDPQTNYNISSVATTLQIVSFDSLSAIRGKGDDSLNVTISYKVNDLLGDNYYLVSVYGDSIPENNFFNFNDDANAFSVAFSDREYPPGKLVREDEFEFLSGDTIAVTLTNISKDYFEYIEARNRSGNSFLSEPISFPTNVTNGYGYFNIHFPSARVIEVQ